MSSDTPVAPQGPYMDILAAEDANPLIHELRRTDPVHKTARGHGLRR